MCLQIDFHDSDWGGGHRKGWIRVDSPTVKKREPFIMETLKEEKGWTCRTGVGGELKRGFSILLTVSTSRNNFSLVLTEAKGL